MATRRRKPYTSDSLQNALALHDVNYSPPEPPGGRRTWLVTTGTGTHEWNASQVHAFCCGLAMAKFARLGPLVQRSNTPEKENDQ